MAGSQRSNFLSFKRAKKASDCIRKRLFSSQGERTLASVKDLVEIRYSSERQGWPVRQIQEGWDTVCLQAISMQISRAGEQYHLFRIPVLLGLTFHLILLALCLIDSEGRHF